MDLLVREWQAFLTALQFLTRIRFCELDFGRYIFLVRQRAALFIGVS